MKDKFTKEQIENWHSYEQVRQQGSYNMFDRNARLITGLTPDEYSFVMRNYSELKEQAEKEKTNG
jgi:hypothetical protein